MSRLEVPGIPVGADRSRGNWYWAARGLREAVVNITSLLSELEGLPTHQVFGKVAAVQGLLVEVSGVQNNLSVGDRCNVIARDGRRVPCEVVGFREGRALVMPFGALEGIGLGCRAAIAEAAPS
ncbi:MAG: hypothetical protein RLN70_11905, partial [Rhodospirillaceae bacterium]